MNIIDVTFHIKSCLTFFHVCKKKHVDTGSEFVVFHFQIKALSSFLVPVFTWPVLGSPLFQYVFSIVMLPKWVFPKIGVPPNPPFKNRVFHYFHHPFLGVSLFLETSKINTKTYAKTAPRFSRLNLEVLLVWDGFWVPQGRLLRVSFTTF